MWVGLDVRFIVINSISLSNDKKRIAMNMNRMGSAIDLVLHIRRQNDFDNASMCNLDGLRAMALLVEPLGTMFGTWNFAWCAFARIWLGWVLELKAIERRPAVEIGVQLQSHKVWFRLVVFSRKVSILQRKTHAVNLVLAQYRLVI